MTLKVRRCIKCSHSLLKRRRKCLHCGHINNGTKHKKDKQIDNWRSLKRGDKIKVKGNDGPYRIVNGEKCRTAHSGKFVVQYLDNNGIHAYGKNGHSYLWMGEPYKNKNDTYMEPYNIELV